MFPLFRQTLTHSHTHTQWNKISCSSDQTDQSKWEKAYSNTTKSVRRISLRKYSHAHTQSRNQRTTTKNIDKNNNEIHKRIMNDDKAWRYNAVAIPTKQKYFRYSHSRPMEISVRLIEQSAKSFAQICF